MRIIAGNNNTNNLKHTNMNTITGYWIKYDKNSQQLSKEPYTIEASIGDRVLFADNSGLADCHINTVGLKDDEWAAKYPAGTSINDYTPRQGRIVKTDSMQTTGIRWNNVEVTMPIAVICDDGQIIYCNPLNIRLVE
jgi:hypothetical protein